MTDNIRDILDLINEMEEDQGDVELHDEFDIELNEDVVIESGVIDINEDGILIDGDEKSIQLLEDHGFTLEETDWSRYDNPAHKRQQAPRQLDIPPGQRTAGMTGPEIRRQSLIKQGILKAQPEPDVKVKEDIDNNPVFNSIARRMLLNNLDLFVKHGPEKVKKAIEEIAISVGSVEEIGSSDISGWVRQVINLLDSKITESNVIIANPSNKTKNRLELIKKIRHFFAKQLNDPQVHKAFLKASDRLDVEKVLGPGDRSPITNEKMVMGLPGDQGSKVMGEGPGDEPVEPDMDSDDKRWDDSESTKEVEESGLQAYLGKKKYGEKGMKALQKAGREGASKEKMAQIRAQYDKLDEVEIDEAKYQGREVPLGKPMKGDVKKSKVYVRKPNGKVVKVNFGDKKMRIKKSNPKRRKSFRARHNCKNPGPRWKARYWSCRAW